jgi:hypothetical protein
MQMRMWGHTVTPGHALQPTEGVYDESIFEALDFILEEARVRGLKLIIIFADNWCAVFLCARLSRGLLPQGARVGVVVSGAAAGGSRWGTRLSPALPAGRPHAR